MNNRTEIAYVPGKGLQRVSLREWEELVIKNLEKNPDNYRTAAQRAHLHSFNHKRYLKRDKVCGCFYCLKIFSPNKIEDWIDRYGTALCPFCGIDSVIGQSSGYPITKKFLEKMHMAWF